MFSFGSPSNFTYTLSFFWLYNLIMYRFKYAVNPNKYVNILLVVLLAGFTGWTTFACALNGVNFFY